MDKMMRMGTRAQKERSEDNFVLVARKLGQSGLQARSQCSTFRNAVAGNVQQRTTHQIPSQLSHHLSHSTATFVITFHESLHFVSDRQQRARE